MAYYGTTFQQMLEAVADTYGRGSDQWVTIAQYGISSPESLDILKQVPGVSLTVSNSGKILGYDYKYPFGSTSNPVATIDSNVQTGTYGTTSGSFNAEMPATADVTGNTMTSGIKTVSTGAKIASIADKASLAVAGVSWGTKLGKLIDQAIYSVNPQWWDENFPSINPETWDDLATTETGKDVIRAIFGLEQDSATMYMDESMLAYTYMTLLENGAYSTGGYDTDQSRVGSTYLNYPNTEYSIYVDKTVTAISPYFNYTFTISTNDAYLFIMRFSSSQSVQVYGCSKTPTTFHSHLLRPNGSTLDETVNVNTSYTKNGRTIYYGSYISSFTPSSTALSLTPSTNNTGYNTDFLRDACMIALYGTEEIPALPGVTDDPTATYHINPDTLINPTTQQPVTPQDNVSDVLEALRTQYPQLFEGRAYADIPQQDGTVERIYYIPTPYPNMDDKEKPVTGPNRQQNPQINPQDNTEEQTQDFVDTVTDPLTTPPETGDGSTPPIVLPTGSASALFTIYNPSQAELNSFGAWLWSPNFIDQLLKLFNDPMQAIIGLHKIFAAPDISGTSTIHVGYLDSGVSSNVVGSQYTDVDCGSVSVDEYFGNVFDYSPFTDIYIFLPFIGIQKLNVGDVMRGSLHVVYHVDILTGACLADVEVIRDGSGGVLYSYAGDCAVQYPISSGSYMGIVTSIASIAGGIIGTVASGGALAPVAMGAIGGALNAHTNVNHSGGFSGNAGAMGIKTPYLIISRPQTNLADNLGAFEGYPANYFTTVGSCTGFIKVNSCHIEGIPATDSELSEIETLLKSGVII